MISIIIPAYNEKLNIKITIMDIIEVLLKYPGNNNYEIIVIDDNSSDATYKEVMSLNNDVINCIRLSRNSGSHIAMRAGLEYAKGEVVVCIFADGQEDSSILPEMLNKWKNGNHIVWGKRRSRDEPIINKVLALLFYKILNILTNKDNNEIDHSKADFFLIDRKVVDAINIFKEKNTSLFGLISWLGYKQDSVEYDRKKRRSGKSKWNYLSSLNLAIDWITAFSGMPLKLMSLIGITIIIIGILSSLFVDGTIVIILILSGFQIIMFGIMGEYLWRNLDESRKRPLYFIEKSTYDDNVDKYI